MTLSGAQWDDVQRTLGEHEAQIASLGQLIERNARSSTLAHQQMRDQLLRVEVTLGEIKTHLKVSRRKRGFQIGGLGAIIGGIATVVEHFGGKK